MLKLFITLGIMENGGIILTSIILLFLAMYVYSYSFEYFEKLREAKRLKKLHDKEEHLSQQKVLNARAREEKSQKLSQRSREIKEELERLAEFKNSLLQRQVEKKAL